MKSILVPTDFSENAFTALNYAITIAHKFGYSVEVFHAFLMPPTGSTVMVNIIDILEKNAREALDVLKVRVESEIPLASSIQITYEAFHGTVVGVIKRRCSQKKKSLVVMGSQGETSFTDRWLGTNASDASKNLDIPLLILPAHTQMRPTPRFLFAVDLKVQERTDAFKFIADLTHHLNAQIKFVHIQNRTSDAPNAEHYCSQLENAFGNTFREITYLANSDIEVGITEAINLYRPDILITIRQNYRFLDSIFHTSVSQKLIRKTTVPIFVLPA